MGHANHFLITIMVGLDAVEDGTSKRESFRTSWNPKDSKASAARSRQYAIKAALAWTVDNLDMYLRLCNRAPRLYNQQESMEIANTKHSVYNKFLCVIKNHPELTPNLYAYIDMLICWRNNSIHFDAENQLTENSLRYFKNVPDDDIVVNKYHLDTNKMVERFNAGACPTFKGVATLIGLTNQFVDNLDQILLREIQQYEFLEAVLYQVIKGKDNKTNVFDRTNTTPEKRQKKLKQFFVTAGITEEFYNDEGERFLAEVAELSGDEFRKQVESHAD